ncbi:MAG: hypothetical protein ABS949_11010 [Solibacillus sp.]
MIQKSKQRIDELDAKIVGSLEEALGIPVFQDHVTEDEFKENLKGKYRYIIFETGGMKRAENKQYTLIQDVLIRLYAEGLPNVDHLQIDVIHTLEKNGYVFVSSDKTAIQKGKEDAYVDEVEFSFTRAIKYVC